MSDAIEMRDLSAPASADHDRSPDEYYPDEYPASNPWAWATATLFLSFAVCLVLCPGLLLFISEPASTVGRRTALTPLESFLTTHFGIWLTAIAVALVLHIPSSETPIQSQVSPTHSHPLLAPLTVAANISALLSYNTTTIGPLAFLIFLGSTVVGVWGLWVIVFGNSSLVSKKTGTDKHTSSFIFGNRSAASVQKRIWRSKQEKSL